MVVFVNRVCTRIQNGGDGRHRVVFPIGNFVQIHSAGQVTVLINDGERALFGISYMFFLQPGTDLSDGIVCTQQPDGFFHDGFDQGAVEYIRCRSEEHTSELQSLMRISYAVFCLKKKKKRNTKKNNIQSIEIRRKILPYR